MTNARSKPGAGGAQYLGPYLIWEPGMSEEHSAGLKREAEERLAGLPPSEGSRIEAIHLGDHLIWDPTMTNEEADRAMVEAVSKMGLAPRHPAPPKKEVLGRKGYVPAGRQRKARQPPRQKSSEELARQKASEAQTLAEIHAALDAAPRAPAPAAPLAAAAPPVEATARRRGGLPPLHRAPEWVWVLILWVLAPMLGMLTAALIHTAQR